MGKIIYSFVLFSLLLSCVDNDNGGQSSGTEDAHYVHEKKEIYLIKDDEFKQQFIMLENDGVCKYAYNFCEGFSIRQTTYSIDDKIIIFKDCAFKGRYINEDEIEIFDNIMAFNCNHSEEHDTVLKKIGKRYYKSKIDNLRLRHYSFFEPSQADIIRLVNKTEKLLYITRIEREETVQSVKGYWYVVETEKGETGCCFSPYVEEIN